MKRTAPLIAALAALGVGVFSSTPAAAAWTRNASSTTSAAKATSVGTPGAGSTGSPTTSSQAITWSAPSSGAPIDGYEVLRGGTLITAGGCRSTATRISTGITCTDDNGLSAGITYSYTVRAIRGTNWVGSANAAFTGATSTSSGLTYSSCTGGSSVACPTNGGNATIVLAKSNQSGSHTWTAKVSLINGSGSVITNSTGSAISVTVGSLTANASITYSSGTALTIPNGASASSNTFTYSNAGVASGSGSDTVTASSGSITSVVANLTW